MSITKYIVNNLSGQTISEINSTTINSDTISATTISGVTFYGDGSNLTGISGTNGSSGTSGINGTSGTSGINGTSGTSGVSGISPTIGSWTLSAGTNTVSFTVPQGESYVMWVNGNIPNGIVNWNATVTLSNSNVPAIGAQYGWYYLAGNALVLTSIPSQIVGTAGSIVTTSPAVSNSNTFTFGITNNSGASQIIYYGYIKIS